MRVFMDGSAACLHLAYGVHDIGQQAVCGQCGFTPTHAHIHHDPMRSFADMRVRVQCVRALCSIVCVRCS